MPLESGGKTGTEDPVDARGGWSAFWAQTLRGDEAVSSDVFRAQLDQFWNEQLSDAFNGRSAVRVLDLACGAGRVANTVVQVAAARGTQLALTCSDFSAEALVIARATIADPEVEFVVADARNTPFSDRIFDVVVSQFGIEYAGEAGFDEAARLVAASGKLIALAHIKDGRVYAESSANAAALAALNRAGVIDRCASLLGLRSAPAVENRAVAEKELSAAFTALGAELDAIGACAGVAFVQRLANDYVTLLRRRQTYAYSDIVGWVSGQQMALRTYATRMDTMLGAALDDAGMAALAERLSAAGLTPHAEPFVGTDGKVAAWALIASRSSAADA